MAGVYWYCFIAVISLGITVLVLYKKKNFYEFISFFLFAMMVAFVGEMIILLFLEGYSYKPGVFTDYYAENIFGHYHTKCHLMAFDRSTRSRLLAALSLDSINNRHLYAFGYFL